MLLCFQYCFCIQFNVENNMFDLCIYLLMHSYLNDRKLSHGVGLKRFVFANESVSHHHKRQRFLNKVTVCKSLSGHIQKSVYHKCSAVKVKFFVVLSMTVSSNLAQILIWGKENNKNSRTV